MWSSDIVITNITLRDSPFWTLHPYDCKNVTIRNLTILAPVFEAPNTDGIDPGNSISSNLWSFHCSCIICILLYFSFLCIRAANELIWVSDSCEDMIIEDCYISVGDDAIAIKSGWDQYGIAYARPSINILIRNLVVRSMVR